MRHLFQDVCEKCYSFVTLDLTIHVEWNFPFSAIKPKYNIKVHYVCMTAEIVNTRMAIKPYYKFSISKHRSQVRNVNNLHNGIDSINYKAGHDLLITYEVFKQTSDKI